VYQCLAASIPLTVVYGSDFSITGYRDREFGTSFAWDTDLLSGYESHFLSRVAEGGATSYETVKAEGLAPLLNQLSPAAVLVLGYATSFDQAAIRQTQKLGLPILFRGETTDHARRRNWLRRVVRDTTLRWWYRRCSRLLYVGRRSHDHFTRLGVPEDRLVFSPYCVATRPFRTSEADRSELRPRTREQLGLPNESIALLFSGKLVDRKGVDLILEAIRRLPQGLRHRMVVLFLGDGELRPQLEVVAQRTPRIECRFLGFQNQTALSQYYHAADLLVLPSREGETWGLVVNEALEHGLPVVAAETVGSVPDLVHPGETGEVISHLTPESIAQAIERAVGWIGPAERRARCRAVVSQYSVAAAAAGIECAFRAVAP
jgi:glycosyltransferase involved in cell wall biosynthesis